MSDRTAGVSGRNGGTSSVSGDFFVILVAVGPVYVRKTHDEQEGLLVLPVLVEPSDCTCSATSSAEKPFATLGASGKAVSASAIAQVPRILPLVLQPDQRRVIAPAAQDFRQVLLALAGSASHDT